MESNKLYKVLVVDDDPMVRILLRTRLEGDGYAVEEAENGMSALERLAGDHEIRIIITDLLMPEMNGFELISRIRGQDGRYAYIIVLSQMSDRKSLIHALSNGADDYMTKPIFLDEVRLRLAGAARLLRLEGQDALIFSMAKMMEFRSEETGYHLERVRRFTRIAARDFAISHPEYRLSLSIADEIALVSPLHDIGKIAVPDCILHKPGKLDAEEWARMQMHTTIGGDLLEELYQKNGTPYLRFAYEIAKFHHEWWDGSGYPCGLAGEEIPLSSRIMALADVYDALTSRRSYKDELSHETARGIILEKSGTQFDPRIVEGFVRQEFEWQAIRERFREEARASRQIPAALQAR